MERKAQTFQSKDRHLQVFLCLKSSSFFPHDPYTSFSSIPNKSEVTKNYQTQFAVLFLLCGKPYGNELGHTAEQEAYE